MRPRFYDIYKNHCMVKMFEQCFISGKLCKCKGQIESNISKIDQCQVGEISNLLFSLNVWTPCISWKWCKWMLKTALVSRNFIINSLTKRSKIGFTEFFTNYWVVVYDRNRIFGRKFRPNRPKYSAESFGHPAEHSAK